MAVVLLPEPPPPPAAVPSAAVVPEPAREVPLGAVVALEEMLPLVLEIAPGFVLFDDDKAELELTAEGLDAVPRLPEFSTEVDEAGVETPVLLVDFSSDAAEAAPPAPAPEDEPPVLEGVAATVPVVDACT